ncbi:MAG: hypothetical protein K0Q79_3652 [Flavipsychrobacter sp.]|jgi:hypothetical protein|nr:hypothetical protein [Flavipsychrobacter sp.]
MSKYRYPQKFNYRDVKGNPEIADIEDHISAELSKGYKYGIVRKLETFLGLFFKPGKRKQTYK